MPLVPHPVEADMFGPMRNFSPGAGLGQRLGRPGEGRGSAGRVRGGASPGKRDPNVAAGLAVERGEKADRLVMRHRWNPPPSSTSGI